MPEPRHLAATLEERARAQAPSRQPHVSPVVAAPHAAVSPLQREDMERTRRFVRPRGEDLHNTWKEGNEFAQVRVARPPPHTRAVPCPMPLRTTARAARAGAGQCAHRPPLPRPRVRLRRRGRRPTWRARPPRTRCWDGGPKRRRTGSRRDSGRAASTTRRKTDRPLSSRPR